MRKMYAYVNGAPLSMIDPTGLYLSFVHRNFTMEGARRAGLDQASAKELAELVVDADFTPGRTERYGVPLETAEIIKKWKVDCVCKK